MDVLGYLSELKSSLGVTFSAHFLHNFSVKMFSYLILYQLIKFECYTLFPSQDTKQNVLLSFHQTIDDAIKFKIYLRSSSKAMTDRERKRRRRKYESLNICQERK